MQFPFRVLSRDADGTETCIQVQSAPRAYEEVDRLLSSGCSWAEILDLRTASVWFAGFHPDVNFADIRG